MHPLALRTRGALGRTLALGVLLALTACSSPTSTPADPVGTAGTADTDASGLTITDPWAKATDAMMSATFGTLHNDGDQDVRVVSASSAVSPMELHEVVTGDDGSPVMRPIDGITVPAGGTAVLEPGGDHLMFVDLSAPLLAGDEVEVTLTTAEGTTLTFTAAVRTFDGADETYVGGGDMSGMDMSPAPSGS